MRHLYLLSLFILTIFSAHGQKPQLNLVQIASGFTSPVDIRNCGDGRIFIIEQRGVVKIMDKQGNINPVPFLDISSRVLSVGNEQGLLTMAFSPNYKRDSCFFVNYITDTVNGITTISRFKVSAVDSNRADSSSERVLLTFRQPFTNHNGATLMFGADGYLYDTQGDGGNAGDPNHNGQNKNVYLAKMLRFDVSNKDTTYTIPPTNPFIGGSNAKPEIWAYGLRNPWRCALDRLTGDIWIADVGQALYEEVNFQPRSSAGGQNYGWRCYEGYHLYDTTGCVGSGFTQPIYEYVHSTANGCSVTGGYVYRGTRYHNMFGKYFFADYCSGRFWCARQTGVSNFQFDTLATFLPYQYSTFGQDNEYEIYIAGRANGKIYHLTDTSSCQPVAFITFADSLSGCHGVTVSALAGDSLSYQWYGRDSVISGATSYLYTASQSGWYRVAVTASDTACHSMSDSVYLQITATPIVHIHPHPAYCTDDSPISLLPFFQPVGGTYSGEYVFGDTLALISGGGGDTVFYTYTNGLGCVSLDTLVFNVHPCDNSGIHDLKDEFSFSISPNPNHGIFTIDIRSNVNVNGHLTVIDELGRICMESDILPQADTSHVLDVSFLSKGVYSVLIKTSNSSAVRRMILD